MMFCANYFGRKRRRPRNATALVGRLSRRLRAEQLERRMMLSANSPAAVPNWDRVDLAVEVETPVSFVKENWGAGWTILEGGFVANGPILMGDNTSQSMIDFDHAGNVSIEDLLTQPGTWISTGTFDSSMEFGTSVNSGFTPRVISDGPNVFDFNWTDSRGSSNETLTAETDEGGLISIEPILETTPGGNHHVERSLALPTKSPDNDKLALSDRLSSSTSGVGDLSGEWARAAVFEVAGGQPVAVSLRASALPAAASIHQASYTQSGETETVALADAENRAAASQTQHVADGDVEHAPQAAGIAPTDGQPLTTDAEHRVTSAVNLGASLEDAVGDANLAAPLTGLPEEAAAAAFAELGSVEPVAVTGSGGQLHLNSWLSGTPLLLMLALERVTARNSRRRKAVEVTGRCGRCVG